MSLIYNDKIVFVFNKWIICAKTNIRHYHDFTLTYQISLLKIRALIFYISPIRYFLQCGYSWLVNVFNIIYNRYRSWRLFCCQWLIVKCFVYKKVWTLVVLSQTRDALQFILWNWFVDWIVLIFLIIVNKRYVGLWLISFFSTGWFVDTLAIRWKFRIRICCT